MDVWVCVCVHKNMYFLYRTILVQPSSPALTVILKVSQYSITTTPNSCDIAPRDLVSYFTDQKLSKFNNSFFH